jgi:hypothetical protein
LLCIKNREYYDYLRNVNGPVKTAPPPQEIAFFLNRAQKGDFLSNFRQRNQKKGKNWRFSKNALDI